MVAGSDKGGVNLIMGTTIVIYTTATSVWIAADSKALQIGRAGYVSGFYQTRKIEQEGHICFACYLNPKLSIDGQQAFDAYEIIRSVISNHQDIYDCFLLIEDRLKESLNHAFAEAIKKDPQLIETFIGKPFVGIVLATVSADGPLLITATYKVVKQATQLNTVQSSFSDEGMPLRLLGSTHAISRFLSENKSFLKEGPGMEDKLFRLIQLEVESSPSWVGLPCNIVRIDSHAFQWWEKS